MKRLVWSLVLMSALFVGSAPEALAHGSFYKSHFPYDGHYVVRHGHHYPSWLARHHDFRRWYWRSPYRYDLYLSWHGLYDIYRYERKYHRPYRHHHRDRHRHRRHHRHH
ncbi:MAG: hypothetical protein ACE5OQ_02860 [Woeseia sp.]